MHAVKDYVDLPLILSDYPVRHTFNLVPSLLSQLESYHEGLKDPVQRLCEAEPHVLTPVHCRELLDWARTIQPTMMEDLPQLRSLLAIDPDVHGMDEQEILDLQTLLLLAWIGPVSRRRRPDIQRMMESTTPASIADRDALLAYHREIMNTVVPVMTGLEEQGQIEISVTPYHHPILPLLCSTDVAQESLPGATVPDPAFSALDDADWHVRAAIDHWHHLSQRYPRGMWPAEGGVSMQALAIMARHGISWAATDEDVLRRTLGSAFTSTSTFAPYTIETSEGTIAMLFRDHVLSDAIGFEYSTWEAEAAADDMVRRLESRRDRIVVMHGEGALATMVVPIMLDGENCWEFYKGNGEPFLRALMERLSDTQRFTSLTCSEAVERCSTSDRVLSTIMPGSWIHGTFEIWIGDDRKCTAWSILRDAREAVREAGDPSDLVDLCRKLEASDWFWWYDERHQAPHKSAFDNMFREHLSRIFETLGRTPTVDLSQPLGTKNMTDAKANRTYPISFGSAAMHDADAITREIVVDTAANWQRFTINLQRTVREREEVVVTVTDRHGSSRRCGIVNGQVLFQSDRHDEGFDRQDDLHVAIFVHAADLWKVEVEEQRESGSLWLCSIDVHPAT
jgi:alpha-amylase/alpha-mannosidase (GH57 family)